MGPCPRWAGAARGAAVRPLGAAGPLPEPLGGPSAALPSPPSLRLELEDGGCQTWLFASAVVLR